jgi:hypothetical protein
MNAVDEEEAKAGKRTGNYGVCKVKLFKCFPYQKKRKFPISNPCSGHLQK